MGFEVLLGDCIESMKKLPAESVDMCVTSPPYYGLRNYGTAQWDGGDAACDHKRPPLGGSGLSSPLNSNANGEKKEAQRTQQYRDTCGKCGAKRVDDQIGLEETLSGYIDNMVTVFNEVHRILKPEGTLWLNLGDSYNGSGGAGGDYNKGGLKEGQPKYLGRNEPTLKRKDLMGVPWRVAFALQEAGWYLRQDIIWAKPNCMPEPIKDRCTKSHEYLFLLTKQEKYYYDHVAIKEPVLTASLKRAETSWDSDHPSTGFHGNGIHTEKMGTRFVDPAGRNKRSVWTVSPKPYKGAHFAVFPPELIEPCILAGTSAKGCCSKCLAPHTRKTGRQCSECPCIIPTQAKECPDCGYRNTGWLDERTTNADKRAGEDNTVGSLTARKKVMKSAMIASTTFFPTCECDADVIPCTVLDPFGGSGTTAGVAVKHGRNAILCELNEEYAALIPSRVESISQIQKEVLNDKREWI